MSQAELVKQKKRTDTELIAAGFRPYTRRKQVVMARQLPVWCENLI
jgi:hypothetical protein